MTLLPSPHPRRRSQRDANVVQSKRRRGEADWRRKRKSARWPWAILLASPFIGVGVAWAWSGDGGLAGGARSLLSTEPVVEQYEINFSPCSSGPRYTCVVDGDTLWLEGEKVRIADINTPEVSSPECMQEAQLGTQATRRLTELLNEGGFSLEAIDRDEDQYGRKLRIVTRDGDSLGAMLVEEGLAEEWTGRRSSWC